jgi:hypothetical protein
MSLRSNPLTHFPHAEACSAPIARRSPPLGARRFLMDFLGRMK